MSLVTYEDVRPWARAIKQRTGIGPKAGVMPPWYVEKNIGIQKFQNDPSLSDDEIATIAKWADSGAPRGNPADMPPPKVYADAQAWAIGTPDLVVKTQGPRRSRATRPTGGARFRSVPTGLTEDRYVAALEIKEVNDVDSQGRQRPRHRRRPLRVPSHDLEHAGARRQDGPRARIRSPSSTTRKR